MPDTTLGIVGVRFFPSDRVHFYATEDAGLRPGDEIQVPAESGPLAARVIIAPAQVIGCDPKEIDPGIPSPLLRPPNAYLASK